LATALAICLAVAWPRPAAGETAPLPEGVTPLERRAYELYAADRLLTARRIADLALAEDPSSVVGHFVRGAVYRRAEGNLPNAMYHLGRAREIYETRWGTSRVGGAAWPLHREILFAVQQVAGEMELWDYQIHVVEYHDMLYDPDLLAEHAWPLIQLGRFDLARGFAEVAVRSSDAFQRSLGLNALCAIEGEAQRRRAYFDACFAAYENAERRVAAAPADAEGDAATGPAFAVHAYNAALAARAVLRPEQAERLALAGTRRFEMTPANPWRLLARLYVDAGRTDDAVSALREMQSWRERQPPHLRDQDRAETDAVFATVLLVAGEVDIGRRAVTRAIDRPDRRSLTSGRAEQALGAHALLRRALDVTANERHAELLSTRGLFARVFGVLESAWRGLGLWPDEERAATVLADEDILAATLLVHVQGGLDPLPVWLLGDVVDVLGAGVVEAALDRAARREESDVVGAYHAALRADVARARGDERRALALARTALAGLPPSEALLRARVAAVGAEAALGRGRVAEASGLFEQAVQADGGVIRRLGLSIPATVEVHASGSAARQVGAMLRRSPRLDVRSGGFRVEVSGADSGLRVCLASRQGAQLSCTETLAPVREAPRTASASRGDGARPSVGQNRPGPAPESTADYARRVAIAFHDRVFALPVQLTTTDVGSLDGRIRADEEIARRRMRGALDAIIDEAEERR
jgi:tetratricopeptide (TPR) repeat protein